MPHNCYSRLPRLVVFLGAALSLFLSSPIFAATLKLAWNSSTDPSIVGYKLAYGTSSGAYTKSLNAGNSTSVTVSSLIPGATYYFVVTAYNGIGLQSLPSNEVALTLPPNVPPSVSLTSPQPNSSVGPSSPIGLSATAADSDGVIVKVEFYEDTTKIGEAATSPYNAVWNNPSSGSYTLTALAYDDSGAAVRSAGVPITITGSSPGASPTPTPAAIKVRPMAMTPIIKAGQTAKFKLIMSQPDPANPMVVNYSLGGTATGGVDYLTTGLTGQITIPARARGALVSLSTKAVPGATGHKTAVLTVMPGTGYNAGRGNAVIRILGH